MATHSSILAWRILWPEEPGGPQYIGSQSVTKHTHTHTHTYTFTYIKEPSFQFPFLIKTKLFLGWGGAVGQ